MYVLQIIFDNSKRLEKNIYFFRYKDIKFKLIQNNPNKYSDVLLSILPSDDTNDVENVFAIGSEYLSALCWQNNSKISIRYGGGYGCNDNNLRTKKCIIYLPPNIPYTKNKLMNNKLFKIPYLNCIEKIKALSLYREALCSNNIYLAFLFYWQILDIKNTKALDWTNATVRKHYNELDIEDDLKLLNINIPDIAKYLDNHGRHAIAHIKRHNGIKDLNINSAFDNKALFISTNIVKKLSKYYIKKYLSLDKSMYCIRINNSFPVYKYLDGLKKKKYTVVYR